MKAFKLLILFLFSSTLLFAETDLAKIQRAIKAQGARWTAGENWVTRLSKEERRKLYGALPENPGLGKAPVITLPQAESFPAALDWRNNNGNWVTPVRNQGGCGSCWAFSAVAQVESWVRIHEDNPIKVLDLSEQFILSCGDAGSCNGGNASSALTFIQETGIPNESCLFYAGSDQVPCSNACATWENQAQKIPGWGFVTLNEPTVENIKAALMHHPVSANYRVYEDFDYYSGGVYEHTWGEEEAGHAILIVGWDDAESCWICKNSWGPTWGEAGYFRIRWGSCGIGKNMPFIWDTTLSGQAASVSPERIETTIEAGQIAVESFTIENSGASTLYYSVIDYEFPLFNVNDFVTWEGNSWNSGHPDIGGYDDHWLQYLDTPVLDLSGATDPQLTFKGQWAIEEPGGEDPPFDGWDGCNVWISTNGGQDFDVIDPVSPQYNCQNLWSFGHGTQGWAMGAGVAGWGGTSGGWTDVTFDLGAYRVSDVVLRFAFASDMGYCARDDQSLTGFSVDDIAVTDGSTTIFANNGVDNGEMTRTGFGSLAAPWITTSVGVSSVEASSNQVVDVEFDATNLAAGVYKGQIDLYSNQEEEAQISIPLTVTVTEPGSGVDRDPAVLPTDWRLLANIPNPFNPSTTLRFDIPASADVRLSVYNEAGQNVRQLIQQQMPAGRHHIEWDGKDGQGTPQASGLYIVRLEAGPVQLTQKVMLIR